MRGSTVYIVSMSIPVAVYLYWWQGITSASHMNHSVAQQEREGLVLLFSKNGADS